MLNVRGSRDNNLLVGVASLNHVAISELLGLGTLASDLAGHRHLSSLGTGLHDKAQDAVASSAHGKAAQKLVLEGLSLSLGAKTTVSDSLSEDFDAILGEVESNPTNE